MVFEGGLVQRNKQVDLPCQQPVQLVGKGLAVGLDELHLPVPLMQDGAILYTVQTGQKTWERKTS